MKLKKEEVKQQLESFIYDRLPDKSFQCVEFNANQLLTWNRFDLALKLYYLGLKDLLPDRAEAMYRQDIRCQTYGRFVEYGQEETKRSFEDYLELFGVTNENIRSRGFCADQSLIPLAEDLSIVNGAHRVASAIYNSVRVTCVVTPERAMVADYQYFLERGLPVEDADSAVGAYIKNSKNNLYLGFLWPAGSSCADVNEQLFEKVIYKKTIKLNFCGAFNLLYELYKHMDWIGQEASGYGGIKEKLLECFPGFDEFKVILFESENLETVRELKKRIRNINNIGFSSIHVTDSMEEVLRISKLVFNSNGVHFLNYAKPKTYTHLFDQIQEYKKFLDVNGISKNDVVVDGSAVLALYGLRMNNDFDFFGINIDESYILEPPFSSHEAELDYHGIDKYSLIYDDRYYFEYQGLKFLSFDQIYKMKSARNNNKDKSDLRLMQAKLEGRFLTQIKAQLLSSVLFYRMKIGHLVWSAWLRTLSELGLYDYARRFYRKFLRNKS